MRPPWTYRCRLTRRNLAIDVDAFSAAEASSLAAAHWGAERDEVAVDGMRRRWMRWIGISTHEAADQNVPMERNWWYSAKLGMVVLTALVAAYVVHATLL